MATKTTSEKIAAIQVELPELRQKLADKEADLVKAKTADKQEKLSGQIAKLKAKIAKKEFELKKLGIAQKKEQLDELAVDIEECEFGLVAEALEIKDDDFRREIVTKARLVLGLKETRLLIDKQEKEAEEFLRRLVSSHPMGWTFNEDVNKRYMYYIIERLLINLQDSPTYSIDFEDLVSWIGKEQALKFVKVNTTALTKAIKDGGVTDTESRTITWQDWEAKRTRKVGEPKVVIKEVDPAGRAKVLVVRPELIGEPIETLRKCTDLTGHELNPLIAAGIVIVAQIRGFSGEQLKSIPGIGSVRANKIIDSISKLSTEAQEADTASGADADSDE